MKRIFLLIIIGVLVFVFAACAPTQETAPAPTERVSLEDARARIAALHPDRDLEIEEITTDALWEEMGVQLYTNVSREQYEYVFAIAGDTALALKELWGSYHFDYALSDMDGDGQKEMLYVYDWGSGIVRSIMGILKSDGSQEQIVPTEEAKGMWTIRNLQAKYDTVACDVSPAMMDSTAVKGICMYKKGEYIFDIEK